MIVEPFQIAVVQGFAPADLSLEAGVRLAVFGLHAHSGRSTAGREAASRVAVEAPPLTLADTASSAGAYLVSAFYERCDARVMRSAVLIGPDGREVLRQRQLFP
ncbi:MAG: hypothetical protein JOZ39_12785, partial [Chloroflexi bacterium]|nr:hypothetical protein [Chloroflexota bacterium]